MELDRIFVADLLKRERKQGAYQHAFKRSCADRRHDFLNCKLFPLLTRRLKSDYRTGTITTGSRSVILSTDADSSHSDGVVCVNIFSPSP